MASLDGTPRWISYKSLHLRTKISLKVNSLMKNKHCDESVFNLKFYEVLHFSTQSYKTQLLWIILFISKSPVVPFYITQMSIRQFINILFTHCNTIIVPRNYISDVKTKNTTTYWKDKSVHKLACYWKVQ